MNLLMRIAVVVMVVVFLIWAGFQYNDPDGFFWMLVHGVASLLGILFLMSRYPRILAVVYGGFCVLYGIVLLIRVILAKEFFFDEQGREMLGLFICAAWAAFLLRRNHTTSAPAEPTTKGTETSLRSP